MDYEQNLAEFDDIEESNDIKKDKMRIIITKILTVEHRGCHEVIVKYSGKNDVIQYIDRSLPLVV